MQILLAFFSPHGVKQAFSVLIGLSKTLSLTVPFLLTLPDEDRQVLCM